MVRRLLARLGQTMLRCSGVEVVSLTLDAALARCQARHTPIQTVIDIGASNGMWSLICRRYFPRAAYFLIEARKEHEAQLRRVKKKYRNFNYLIAAAGDTVGQIFFDATDLFGGLASHSPLERNCITVPVVTVDSQVAAQHLQPPFLLKLDTHGFEVPIFEGAQETLKSTQLIIVETYNFKLTADSLRFHEMCSYLEEHGFRCVDICEPLHRPKDHSFWQMDLFFAPSRDDIFQSNSYT